MERATRKRLAEIARVRAERPFHGELEGAASTIGPIIRLFPRWSVQDADRRWCAAFVYYCCVEAGFDIPYSPGECVTCSLAGCGGWEEFARGNGRIEYHGREEAFAPAAGDIVLYDRVFAGRDHDHIGIVCQAGGGAILAAEGNVGDTNTSGLVRRPVDGHIRAYIRIPDGYRYEGASPV